jgi:hypothetical protein
LLRLRAVEFHYVLPGIVQLPSRDVHGQQQLAFSGHASHLAPLLLVNRSTRYQQKGGRYRQ